MKQNKKQNLELYFIMSLIMIIILLGLFVLERWASSDEYFCFKNPDKCVYEPTQKFLDFASKQQERHNTPKEYCANLFESDNKDNYCKLRKKTQAELQIDDCNNNPRDDELCKCE